MWHAMIDEKNQRFVIEDRDGELIASKQMPTQKWPNSGKDELMKLLGNAEARKRVLDLVETANKGAK